MRGRPNGSDCDTGGLLRVSCPAQLLSPGQRSQQLWGGGEHISTFSKCFSQCKPDHLWPYPQKT